jgi:hypothetical protein
MKTKVAVACLFLAGCHDTGNRQFQLPPNKEASFDTRLMPLGRLATGLLSGEHQVRDVALGIDRSSSLQITGPNAAPMISLDDPRLYARDRANVVVELRRCQPYKSSPNGVEIVQCQTNEGRSLIVAGGGPGEDGTTRAMREMYQAGGYFAVGQLSHTEKGTLLAVY